jgi:hypothetical protein
MVKSKTPRKKNSKLAKILERCIWAEYHADGLVPKYVVRRFDDKSGNRFYYFETENGEVIIASGITSAFGTVSTERDGINRWKEKYPTTWKHLLKVSSEYGTMLHIIFGNITLKKGVDKTLIESMKKLALDNGQSADMPIKDTLALMKFSEDYELVPLLVEAQLVYQDPKSGAWLCMTIDLLARMITTEVVKTEVQDGVYTRGERKGEPKMVIQKTEIRRERILIGDLKSNFFEKEDKSFFETHKMQLIGGAKAVEQNFGIKVDGAFNLCPNAWRTKPDCTYFEHNITDEDLTIFDAYMNLIVTKKINVPKGNLLICNDFKDSNDFQLLSYQEYAEQELKKERIIL